MLDKRSIPKPLEDFLSRLSGVRSVNGHYKACCPAHDDHDPSLEVGWSEDRETVWFRCWSQGCDKLAILKKLDLRWENLYLNGNGHEGDGRIVAIYDYTSPTGDLLHQTIRYEPKDFKQRRPDGNGGWKWTLKGMEPVLYNLPGVMRAVLGGETVYVLEGEKDCDRAREELGLVATTCPMGAEKWRDSYTHVLRGAHVVFMPDNDEAGRRHVFGVARKLEGVAKTVKVVELPGLPEKGDLSDWIDAGGTREQLDPLVLKTSQFDSDQTHTPPSMLDPNRILPFKTVREIFNESGEAIPWAVEGILARGSITEISGAAKLAGKTTFLLDMASCLLEGLPFLGRSTKKCKVAFLTEQGNNLKEALRLAGLGPDTEELHILQYLDVRGRNWHALAKEACDYCAEHRIGALFVDTMAEFGQIEDENLAGPVRDAMQSLKRAAQNYGLAVAYTRHHNKQNKGRGSSQFEADCDFFFTLTRPEGNHKDTIRVLNGEGRSRQVPKNLYIELEEGGYVAVDAEDGDNLRFKKAVRAIKAILPRKREHAKERGAIEGFLKPEGLSGATLKRVLRWLVDENIIRKIGRGVKGDPERFWLPTDEDAEFDSDQTSRVGYEFDPNRKEGESGKVVPLFPEADVPEADAAGNDRLVTDAQGVETLVAALSEVTDYALDLETTGLSPIEDRVRLLSLRVGDRTVLVDCFAVDPVPVLEAMKGKTVYVHGAEFDLPFLHHRYGFGPPEDVVDTLHLSQVVRAGEWRAKDDGEGWEREKHGLENALERELGVTLGDKKKYQRGTAWTGDLTDEHLDYAEGDVVHLKALAERLFALVEERELGEVWDLEQRAKPLFLQMCCQGIPFDEERWRGLVADLEGRVRSLKEAADNAAPPHPEGTTWNWNSPQQAMTALSVVGIKLSDVRRETLAKHDHELVKAVAGYRDTQSLLSRVRKWAAGRRKDGRVYPRWNPAGAATGRASCTDPNVQSLPKGEFRGCVRPEEGRVLVKADLNQIELRVLAAITGDEGILGVFRDGGDLHVNTAKAVAGREVKKGDPERQRAKAINFGLSFGMGAKKFKETAARDYGVEMTLSEAREAKRKLLAAYPAMGRWHEREAAECEAGNFVTHTLLGRRRVVEPGRDGAPSFTERLNAPVQGTAADILKLALAKLWACRDRFFPGALPVLTVHDEVVIECDRDTAEEIAERLSLYLRDAVANVLGRPELAGEDAVETTILDSWGGDR